MMPKQAKAKLKLYGAPAKAGLKASRRKMHQTHLVTE